MKVESVNVRFLSFIAQQTKIVFPSAFHLPRLNWLRQCTRRDTFGAADPSNLCVGIADALEKAAVLEVVELQTICAYDVLYFGARVVERFVSLFKHLMGKTSFAVSSVAQKWRWNAIRMKTTQFKQSPLSDVEIQSP